MPKFTTIAAAIKLAAGREFATDFSAGNGLYLIASPTGAASWVLRYRVKGPRVAMGLGSGSGLGKHKVSFADARKQANKLLTMFHAGEDPRAERRRQRQGDTFKAVFDLYLTDKVPAKSHDEWRASMRNHASRLMTMRVANITTDDVLSVLRPLWGKEKGAEAISRVQDRISRVLSAAVTAGHITENVARWDGHLKNVLAAKPSKKNAEGHAMLPHADLPAFVAKIAGLKGAAAQALLFTILTWARAGEVLGALKSEIDREARVWRIPAERMKAGKAHFVPLSDQAMDIVNARWDLPGEHLFATVEGKQLGDTALNDKLCKPVKKGGLAMAGVATVHGFRATASTWAQATRLVDAEIVEMCLAHTVKVEASLNPTIRAAYARAECEDFRRDALQLYANVAFGVNVRQLKAVA